MRGARKGEIKVENAAAYFIGGFQKNKVFLERKKINHTFTLTKC